MLDRVPLRHFARLSSAILAAAFSIALVAYAQNDSSVRAARLTSVQGTVTVTDGNNPTVAAQLNLPLLQGVQIATADDGQAEIEFEDGSVARLTPNTTLSLDTLAIAPGGLFTTDMSLLRGLAYFELRATPEYVYSVNAGGDVLSPVENATVRVDFDEQPASFAVLDGSARVERGGGFQTDVTAGESLRTDPRNASRYFLTDEIASDSWDQWNADMDQQESAQSADTTAVRDDYAGGQGYGWSDLDANGTWYDVQGQGQVWQPYDADASDFDPYGNGAWVWYPGTGYLWASGYSWGWTPYRCGTWSYYSSFGWGWAPSAACGGSGWGFAGGGFVVNVGTAPRGYRTVRVPIARPGPVRPVVPVRLTIGGGQSVHRDAGNRGPRQIGGVTARPITPSRNGFAGQGAQNGAQNGSLQRDFPIDRTTHRPTMGQMSQRPTNVYHVGAQQPQQNGQQPQYGGQNGQQPQYGQRPQNGQQQPQSGQQQNGQQRRGGGNSTAPAGQGALPPVIYGTAPGSGSGSGSGSGAAQQQQPQPQPPSQPSGQQGGDRRSNGGQNGGQGGGQGSGAPQPGQGAAQSSQEQGSQRQRGLQPGSSQPSAPARPSAPAQPSAPAEPAPPPPYSRPQHVTPQQQSTPRQDAQPQRYTPPPPPAQEQHSAPQRPNNTPPPQEQRQNYASPPTGTRPNSSLPPAPRSAPPPSPPAAPHVSAPPPAPANFRR